MVPELALTPLVEPACLREKMCVELDMAGHAGSWIDITLGQQTEHDSAAYS